MKVNNCSGEGLWILFGLYIKNRTFSCLLRLSLPPEMGEMAQTFLSEIEWLTMYINVCFFCYIKLQRFVTKLIILYLFVYYRIHQSKQ